MRTSKQRFIVLLFGLVIVLLLSVFAIVGLGEEPPGSQDFVPTAYVYLPLAVTQPTPTPDPSIPPDDLANEQAIADLINQQRRAHGLPALALVPELTQAARRHSRDMADHNFVSHTGSDGSSYIDRVREAGYDGVAGGEIIGAGFGGDPQAMVSCWMNSPGHRSLILSPDAEEMGVGYTVNHNSAYGHYWTVDFGSP